MKEIKIMPSDEAIKELWELKQELKVPKIVDPDADLTYEEYYKKHKKPLKILVNKDNNIMMCD